VLYVGGTNSDDNIDIHVKNPKSGPDQSMVHIHTDGVCGEFSTGWVSAPSGSIVQVVAYGLDGKMLEPAHGAPARVFSPIKLGYKNTKYLTRIVFLPKMNGGYWSDQGYEWYGGT
jgi:hypothetical protein